MQTLVLKVDAARPDPTAIARAAEALRRGDLVAFPTETVYGLGANALDADAVARIFAAKGRPAGNPLIVHLAEPAEATQVVGDWPEGAARLAARFWPGPLTLVLPRRDTVPGIVTAGGPTVAVRVPSHPVALALLRAAGVPVAAPSANRSQRVSPTRAQHVLRSLEGRIEILLDAGPTAGGLESTVVDLTASPPRVLRPGPVTPAEIEAVVGPVERPHGQGAPHGPARSPGLMRRHYAPRARVELVGSDGRDLALDLARAGEQVGWLALGAAPAPAPSLTAVPMPADPAGYAARLYAALHALDDAGVDCIVVALPPDTEAWLAVRDRLHRAASRG